MQLLSLTHLLILLVTFSNVIVFSSDKYMGTIDTFVLKQEIQAGTASICRYLTNYSKSENHFIQHEPIFITIDGSLHAIQMPTKIKPFIVIINNAQNIIDANPHIFSLENIKNKISFLSQNQSNSAVHAKLDERIVPLDHCTYAKENNGSIDIISIFFNKEFFSEFIPKLQISRQRTLLDIAKKKRLRDFLSIPRNNHSSSSEEFDYKKKEKNQSIVQRANMRYWREAVSSDDEDLDIIHVPNHDFWDNTSSD